MDASQLESTLEIPTSSANQSLEENPRFILFSHLTMDHNSSTKRENIRRKNDIFQSINKTINQP